MDFKKYVAEEHGEEYLDHLIEWGESDKIINLANEFARIIEKKAYTRGNGHGKNGYKSFSSIIEE